MDERVLRRLIPTEDAGGGERTAPPPAIWGRARLSQLHEVTPELEARFVAGAAGGSRIAQVGYVVDGPAAESARLEAAVADAAAAEGWGGGEPLRALPAG